MEISENSLMRKSQLRPPSRIPGLPPSPSKGLAEISESESNVRSKPSALQPPRAGSKTNGFSLNEMEPKRKTLAERAGEPARSNTNSSITSRSTVKGTSLVGAGTAFTGARNTSFASSTTSRSGISSRNASNSSYASSVGPGSRPLSSYGNRPQTSMAFNKSTTTRPALSRPQTSMASKRPASSMDDPEDGPSDGKRQAWDVHGRIEDMEAMYLELKSTLKGSHMERNGLEEAVTQYKTRLLELESIRAQLESKNTILQTELDTTQQRLLTTRNALDDERRTLDDERRSHRIEADEQKRERRNEMDSISRELSEERRREVEKARRELTEETERLIRVHRDELRELERRFSEEVEDERRRRIQEVSDIKSQIAVEQQNLDVAVGSKDREIQNMRGELDGLRGELEREQALKGNLQKNLAESSSTVMTLENSVRTLQAHVEFLKSDSKAQSDSFVSLERQLQEALTSAKESKAKLIKEETLRRILFNQVQELKGNIRVMCRVRPTNDNDPGDDMARVAYPDVEKESRELEIQGPEETSSLGKVTRKTNAFAFDQVFGPTATNEDVFEEISQLVQSALDGYNVCIFCYGQTGAGKTYTMSSADGMIPRATHQIYDTAKKLEEKGWSYSMEGSFIEVYNEDIHDLLGNAKDYDKKKHEIIHDQQKKQTTVTGLKSVPLDSPNTVESILKQAAANRSVAATKSNERSSRSHSVFILKLVGKNSATNETSEGTLNLVDLAGSERLKISGAEGDRMKETQNINKSLSCLGDVIGALGQGKEGAHIPYRNSKLTYLLQYSLGGNSKTLMFVMISPLEAHLKETLTSLKFATKVHNTHIGTAKKSKKSGD